MPGSFCASRSEGSNRPLSALSNLAGLTGWRCSFARAVADYELRGFAPIGILECWNTGIMGFGELTEWVIGKTRLTKYERNEKSGSKPFGRRGIYIIPIFHHSMCGARLPSLIKYV
jgi:hypothetical protein